MGGDTWTFFSISELFCFIQNVVTWTLFKHFNIYCNHSTFFPEFVPYVEKLCPADLSYLFIIDFLFVTYITGYLFKEVDQRRSGLFLLVWTWGTVTAVLFILLVDIDNLLIVWSFDLDFLSVDSFNLFLFAFYHVSSNKIKMEVNKKLKISKKDKVSFIQFTYTL